MVDQPGPRAPNGLSSILILGANGQIGRWLARKLCATGARVTGIDLDPTAAETGPYSAYVSADLTVTDNRIAAAVQQARCIVVCLSETAALAALPNILEHISPGTLLVDTLSVKTTYLSQISASATEIECLSINPMFSPSLDCKDQNVAIIEVAAGALTREFVSLLTDWGANVTSLTPDEYDELTALTQVATHAAVIAFGSLLNKLGYDVESALRIATPPHRVLLYLLARILTADPEVYWEIQHGYPHAAKIRTALAESIAELDHTSTAPTPQEFARLLEAIRNALGPETEKLAKNCAAVFERDQLSLRTDHD
jgi:prephenate dehydrogenase